jgi:hypothetical protein
MASKSRNRRFKRTTAILNTTLKNLKLYRPYWSTILSIYGTKTISRYAEAISVRVIWVIFFIGMYLEEVAAAH